MRAYRSRHLAALTHCCEAWEPVGQCFDSTTFVCVNFHGLSQIIAGLTRVSIAESHEALRNLPWTQTEKDKAQTKCRRSHRAWCAKKPRLTLHAGTDEEGRPLNDVDDSDAKRCLHWAKVFEGRIIDDQDHSCETILDYVQ